MGVAIEPSSLFYRSLPLTSLATSITGSPSRIGIPETGPGSAKHRAILLQEFVETIIPDFVVTTRDIWRIGIKMHFSVRLLKVG